MIDIVKKEIPGTGGSYLAASDGVVYSADRSIWKMNRWGVYGELRLKGRPLKPWSDSSGYDAVTVYVNKEKRAVNVHRLIAMAFHGEPDAKMDVNHIDGNKKNNRPENLEWCTRKENMAHAERTGLFSVGRKTLIGTPISGGDEISFSSSYEAGIFFGAKKKAGNIRSAANGDIPSAYGHTWRHA